MRVGKRTMKCLVPAMPTSLMLAAAGVRASEGEGDREWGQVKINELGMKAQMNR